MRRADRQERRAFVVVLLIFIVGLSPLPGQDPSVTTTTPPTQKRRYKMKDIKHAPRSPYDSDATLSKWDQTLQWVSILTLAFLIPGSRVRIGSRGTDVSINTKDVNSNLTRLSDQQ